MPGQAAINDQAFLVAPALSGGVSRYAAVVQDTTTAGQVTYGTAVNAAKFIGIAQEDQIAGQEVNVRMIGTSYAIADGAVAIGDSLIIAAGTNGHVQSVGAQSTPNIVGRALTQATAQGDLILINILVQ